MPAWNLIREWTDDVNYYHTPDVVWDPAICLGCGLLIMPLNTKKGVRWATFGDSPAADLACNQENGWYHEPDELATIVWLSGG
jgi:hypothetical protein